VSEKRAVDSTELDNGSDASCVHVYDVEKLTEKVCSLPAYDTFPLMSCFCTFWLLFIYFYISVC